ncbi:MAG TPA: thioredoxin fold domain-containing protein [Burkholderiales bacterium]|nr:thioredoxin fold domain-containing protein [Burkholderiales bacterium]
MLIAFLLAAAVPAHAREVPDWFADAILDVRDEAADAAKAGKRLMLYFWLEGCPYCQRMTSVTFRDPAMIERLKRGFVPVAINVRGDRDIAWTDGATLTEKQLTAKLEVRATPTILFLNGKGEIVLRLTGYVAPAEFGRALDSLSTAPTAALRSASPR